MKQPDKEVLGQFFDGHFVGGQLPKEIFLMGSSSKDSSLNGRFS